MTMIPGFSTDGYIIDQSKMGNIPYGRFKSDWNGCGWMAVYNVLHSFGIDADCRQLAAQMSRELHFGGMFGTPVKNLIRYFQRCGLSPELVYGKENVIASCRSAKAGVLRYFDGEYDHYVSFICCENEKFRFFNADEGNESHVETMNAFISARSKRRRIRAIILSRP